MSDEIAEFLRRAAARRAQLLQQQQEQQRRAAEQSAPPASAPAPTPTLVPAPRREVITAEVRETEEEPSRLSKVGQQVRRDLDTRKFSERAEHMADVTEQSDERLEQHLHQKFDHKLGKLSISGSKETGTEMPTESISRAGVQHALLRMLADINNFRTAFILSEILKRPE